jgi:LytS/YehU family sensor histidine kinase
MEFFEKQKELEKAYSDKLEIELKFLKSQINPHVLFNSLNTIYAQALKKDEDIAEMILMLSENLEYVLNQSNDVMVSLEKDISFIENHLEFKALRTQGIYNIIYKKEIDSYKYSIAPLVLVDLIENAFKYALYKANELSDISIFMGIQKGQLHFTCENEFDSSSQKRKKKNEIGLKNARQRLALLYKNKHTLDIRSDNGIFLVELKMDLQ